MHSDAGHADRRIHRTRATLFEALVSLIGEKEFEAISVKDITARADVNRSTFYAHYRDKFDLLEHLIQEKLGELAGLLHPDNPAVSSYRADFDEPDSFLFLLFEHISRHEKPYRTMLEKLEPRLFASRLYEVIRESQYLRISAMKMEQKLSVPLDILLDYFSSSLTGMIRIWLARQTMYSPHYMALQLTRLGILGTYRTAGAET